MRSNIRFCKEFLPYLRVLKYTSIGLYFHAVDALMSAVYAHVATHAGRNPN